MNVVEVVKESLYFSGQIDDWKQAGAFHAIVNMQIEGQDVPPSPADFEGKYLIWAPVGDWPLPQAQHAPSVAWLDAIAGTVALLIKRGLKVLIHCAKGENRSGLVVAAVLMKTESLTAEQALTLLRFHKPSAVWNQTWVNKLAEYETFLANRQPAGM